MRKNIRYIFLFAGILSLAFNSCKKTFLREELNNDPTTSINPDPKIILPTVLANLAYVYGGDIARLDALITQQVAGGGNQMLAYDMYNYSNADFDNMWNSLYTTTLNNTDKMEKYCSELNYTQYVGICKTIKAFSYSVLVDHFGDIPFSEALMAPEIFQPKFDQAQNVYDGIFVLLHQSDSLLNEPDALRMPGADDILFNGRINNWIKFNHALRARLYMHLKQYAQAQASLVSANGIDVKFKFESPASGPMRQFDDNRFGDLVYMESYLFSTMSNIGDSRIYAYVDTSYNSLGSVFYDAAAPIYFVSAMEQKFMEAEILARDNDPTAATVLADAVQMSFDFTGDTTGMAASMAAYPYQDTDPLNDRLRAVMMQKYFAMFLQPETFADWRRTGYPNISPNSGSNIPRRFLYPTDETNTNSNTPGGVTLYTPRIFWDN